MLGQPITMLIPQVVGKFVEFFGDGLKDLPVADRATIANMAPEYGATCGIFPIDGATLRYLELTGRSAELITLVEAYARAQGLFRIDGAEPAQYSELLELNLGSVEPSLAGPRRPQDRIGLGEAKPRITEALHVLQEERSGRTGRDDDLARFADEGGGTAVAAEEAQHVGVASVAFDDQRFELRDGTVVIAAITSGTNTSNPAVMVAAGLLARKARALGLTARPWVKTSLAPGSMVVKDYLEKAGLLDGLAALGFQIVGYGCTTCVGNSGPLLQPISEAVRGADLVV
jgi:aconitate hydratase